MNSSTELLFRLPGLKNILVGEKEVPKSVTPDLYPFAPEVDPRILLDETTRPKEVSKSSEKVDAWLEQHWPSEANKPQFKESESNKLRPKFVPKLSTIVEGTDSEVLSSTSTAVAESANENPGASESFSTFMEAETALHKHDAFLLRHSYHNDSATHSNAISNLLIRLHRAHGVDLNRSQGVDPQLVNELQIELLNLNETLSSLEESLPVTPDNSQKISAARNTIIALFNFALILHMTDE